MSMHELNVQPYLKNNLGTKLPLELVVDVADDLLEAVGVVDGVAESGSVDDRQAKFDAAFLDLDGRGVQLEFTKIFVAYTITHTCSCKNYMIMIIHRLYIYTSMKHSLLSLKCLALVLNSLDTLSDARIFRIFGNKPDLNPETLFYCRILHALYQFTQA